MAAEAAKTDDAKTPVSPADGGLAQRVQSLLQSFFKAQARLVVAHPNRLIVGTLIWAFIVLVGSLTGTLDLR